jgi:RimJ/RimL family protein N-acetyltransferase
MEQRKFDFVEVTLEPEDYDKVKEIYRLHKEQKNKIFDLSSGIKTDEDILEYVKDKVDYCIVLMAIDKLTGKYAGVIILDETRFYYTEDTDYISSMVVHIVINKSYWGKQSREILNDCLSFINENMKPVLRIEAYVPSHNFGVIKLLKDMGFKIEGTLRNKLIYKDKNGNDKFYNELVYSKILKEI